MEGWFERLAEDKQTEIWNAIGDNIGANIKSYIADQIEDIDEEEAIDLFDIGDSDFIEEEENGTEY